jgi:LPXTG-motif cell wall-anchored protein
MFIISNSKASWIKHEQYTFFTLIGAIIVLAGAVMTVFRKNKPAKAIV